MCCYNQKNNNAGINLFTANPVAERLLRVGGLQNRLISELLTLPDGVPLTGNQPQHFEFTHNDFIILQGQSKRIKSQILTDTPLGVPTKDEILVFTDHDAFRACPQPPTL